MTNFQAIASASSALATWYTVNQGKLTVVDMGLYHIAQGLFHIAAQIAIINDNQSPQEVSPNEPVPDLLPTRDDSAPGPVSDVPTP